MPYLLQGRIADAIGQPIMHVAEIREVALPGTIGGSILSNEDTGNYQFFATSDSSVIIISANGYQPQTFTAKAVPAVVKLQDAPESVITATRVPVTRPKSNAIWWVLGIFGTAVGVAVATGKKAPKPKTVVV